MNAVMASPLILRWLRFMVIYGSRMNAAVSWLQNLIHFESVNKILSESEKSSETFQLILEICAVHTFKRESLCDM